MKDFFQECPSNAKNSFELMDDETTNRTFKVHLERHIHVAIADF